MGGTMYDNVIAVAGQLPFVRDYFQGRIDKGTFRDEVLKNGDLLLSLGLDEPLVRIFSRFTNNEKDASERMLNAMYSAGEIESCEFDEQGYMSWKSLILQKFAHLPDRYTSIFPEETRVAYALSTALHPRNIFVAGSYYGYLSVWLIPGIAPNCQMICSDIDPDVCRLAERNIKALNVDDRVNIICEDAEILLKSKADPIDLFVLDAIGKRSNADPQYRGKSIYFPLIKAALPRLHNRSFIMAHNAEKDSHDLSTFFKIVNKANFFMLLNTTENMGIFRL